MEGKHESNITIPFAHYIKLLLKDYDHVEIELWQATLLECVPEFPLSYHIQYYEHDLDSDGNEKQTIKFEKPRLWRLQYWKQDHARWKQAKVSSIKFNHNYDSIAHKIQSMLRLSKEDARNLALQIISKGDKKKISETLNIILE